MGLDDRILSAVKGIGILVYGVVLFAILSSAATAPPSTMSGVFATVAQLSLLLAVGSGGYYYSKRQTATELSSYSPSSKPSGDDIAINGTVMSHGDEFRSPLSEEGCVGLGYRIHYEAPTSDVFTESEQGFYGQTPLVIETEAGDTIEITPDDHQLTFDSYPTTQTYHLVPENGGGVVPDADDKRVVEFFREVTQEEYKGGGLESQVAIDEHPLPAGTTVNVRGSFGAKPGGGSYQPTGDEITIGRGGIETQQEAASGAVRWAQWALIVFAGIFALSAVGTLVL